jgi:large subunit ribosomal protein L19
MLRLIEQIEADYLKPSTSFVKGQILRVDVQIQEGNKTRIQSYTGALISQHRAGLNSTITVRKLSKGIGVERIFPVHSPDIKAIEPVTVKKGKKQKQLYG